MIRLFVHEVFRVFYDCLVEDSDRAWLFKLVKGIVKEHFKEEFDSVFEHLTQGNTPVSRTFCYKLVAFIINVRLESFSTTGEILDQMCLKI